MPDPAALIDPEWDEQERTDVGLYLRYGLVARVFMGYSQCRLCDDAKNGDLELTDGTYIWPQGLAHYVLDHHVRLPQEFVEHVVRSEEAFDDLEVDGSWWRSQGEIGR